MRYLILFILCAVGFTASAQVQYREGVMIDTSTNAETVYLYPGDAATAAAAVDFKENGALEVVMVYDSLTGNPAGTAVLQFCYDDACAYTYDAATLTVNGATQVVSRTEDTDFTARKFRIKQTTTGTQTSQHKYYYTWKRKI